MSTLSKLAAFAVLIVLVGIGATRLFGTTVSSKFQSGNAQVSSQVVFDAPGSYGSASAPRQVARNTYSPPPVRVQAPAQPEPAPFIAEQQQTELDSTSTFAIDVDTGSYTLSRRYLTQGAMPFDNEVRVEEFVNYFAYDYAMPIGGKTAAVHFEAAPSPFATDSRTHLLRIGLQARSLAKPVPVHLTFLVDTSGSMGTNDRLSLAKESMRTAVRNLAPTDSVAIVTYSGTTEEILGATSAGRTAAIERAIDGLRAGGGTAMSAGMELAYRSAAAKAGPNRVSRVIVMSDGDANIGSSSPRAILDELRSWAEEGVTLSTIGFGMGNYRDDMMEQLADAGDGNYSYIDSADEASRVFGDELQSMLHVVAYDVKTQVEFDPRWVQSWRQVGYENRQIADRDFRNDQVDAGELGAEHQVTALYEVTLAPGIEADSRLATVRFRHKKPGEWKAEEAEFVVDGRRLRHRIGDASTDFRFQAAVATFAEVLRGREGVSFGWIEEVASGATNGRPEREQFRRLVRRASEVQRRM